MKKVLLTVEELAAALQISVKSVRRAYWKGDIPVERVCRFVRFDLDAVKAALREKGHVSLQRCLSERTQRSATGGDSRRRAQRTRPRLGKTGASIARKG
ncbi:MAG: helix-turn-helix domain-containing protein [Nitrospiraceae bacterium]|nr:helix-turn-helix domain-containing protein [Nitrospiraceae bacterium]